ncbi:MAG: DUF5670 family protein [Ignavibacteriaceae bacterium]
MPHIVGLGLLLLWSLGFLTPYSLIGFIEILIILALVHYILRKVNKQKLLKIKSSKKVIEPVFENSI